MFKRRGNFENVTPKYDTQSKRRIRKMNKFGKNVDNDLLYYVAFVLDPRTYL